MGRSGKQLHYTDKPFPLLQLLDKLHHYAKLITFDIASKAVRIAGPVSLLCAGWSLLSLSVVCTFTFLRITCSFVLHIHRDVHETNMDAMHGTACQKLHPQPALPAGSTFHRIIPDFMAQGGGACCVRLACPWQPDRAMPMPVYVFCRPPPPTLISYLGQNPGQPLGHRYSMHMIRPVCMFVYPQTSQQEMAQGERVSMAPNFPVRPAACTQHPAMPSITLLYEYH